MDERQKLLNDLAHYLTARGLTTDQEAVRAIDEKIRDIEIRLTELDRSQRASAAGETNGEAR
jgi:hypothetical protein